MRSARRSKPLSRHLAASCSARERATWTDASVLEALLPRLGLACWRLLCLCSCGSLAEKQRRSWDVRRTWPAAVAVALGFASPVMSVAVRRPSRMMDVATRPGVPASGAHGHRDGGTKRATSTNDAPASGGRSPSQPPGQRMQARQQEAAAASASAGLDAAAAPLRGRCERRVASSAERSKTSSQFNFWVSIGVTRQRVGAHRGFRACVTF